MAGNNLVLPLVSIFLVVAVVLGAVLVLHIGSSNDAPSKNNNQIVSTGYMKSVTTFCQYAEYKDSCAKSISPVAKNQSATTKDFILAALKATIEEVTESHKLVVNTQVDENADPYSHMALEDCKDMLEDAIDDLEASLSVVGDSSLQNLNDRGDELLNWVSAVYAYQTTCTEQIEKPEYKSAIQDGMINATQLTNNVINIIADMAKVLEAFNITKAVDLLHSGAAATSTSSSSTSNSTTTTNSRRLLQEDGDFPSWFPAADRKLLAAQRAGKLKPNVVVAKDGSGKFKSIKKALKAYPKKYKRKYTIYVKAGVYDETVVVKKKMHNIFMYGDGAGKTIITGKKNFAFMKITTSKTATFSALGERFVARGITFRNTAGAEGHQAVAYRSQSDMSALFDCSIEGYQDTLYYHTYRQFYRNCVISGTIDFIFGKGSALIQNSVIIARKPLANQFNTITADGKALAKAKGGVVLQNCRIVPEAALFPSRFKLKTYLGRPWKAYSTSVVMESQIGDVVNPIGWKVWDGEKFEDTSICWEYKNFGPGANTVMRNRAFKKWEVVGPIKARQFTVGSWLNGNSWLPATGIPFALGFTRG
nr:pectinesterase-like [Ipomoea trifida]